MEFNNDVESCVQDFSDLGVEYKVLEDLNREYITKLEEVGELQAKCMKQISHQKYRLGIISRSLKELTKNATDKVSMESIQGLEKDLLRRKAQLHEMEQSLPKENGLYLKIILGNVNVSILNKNDKFRYKDEYEKFKLILSGIGFVVSVINLFTNIRALELSLMFLLVWYYCTLTIRESILKVNGSRIKGWWRMHHFISTVVSGVLLIWPNTAAWYEFRQKFMWFNVYISVLQNLQGMPHRLRALGERHNMDIIKFEWLFLFTGVVQYLQFRYQQGVLYRLKALGERHNMDITIEGFHSWMWRGLSFLLPFLYLGYVYQLYLAYTLYSLSYHEESTWQVPVLSAMFFVIFLGNTITTSMVIPQKLQERMKLRYQLLVPSWGANKLLGTPQNRNNPSSVPMEGNNHSNNVNCKADSAPSPQIKKEH